LLGAEIVTTKNLYDVFVPFGEIVDIAMPRHEDAPPQRTLEGHAVPPPVSRPHAPAPHRGFGYVEFDEAGDAAAAIDNMDQAELQGRVIRVAKAKARDLKGEGLGSNVAVWEQEGWLAKNAAAEKELNDENTGNSQNAGGDPMEGLEKLDTAGPQEK